MQEGGLSSFGGRRPGVVHIPAAYKAHSRHNQHGDTQDTDNDVPSLYKKDAEHSKNQS